MPRGRSSLSATSPSSSPASTRTEIKTSFAWPGYPPPAGGVSGDALYSFEPYLLLLATLPFITLPVYASLKNGTPVEGSVRQPLAWLEPQLNRLYISSLMAPASVKHSPVDLWGNMKVPLMSHYTSGQINGTGWYNFKVSNDKIPYSSLIGIPAAEISQEGITTFSMESSYFDIDCYNLSLSSYISPQATLTTAANADGPMTRAKRLPKLLKTPKNTFYGHNDTESSLAFGIDGYVDWDSGSLATIRDLGMSSFIGNVTGSKRTFFKQQQNFLFESKLRSGFYRIKNPTTVAHCNIKKIYVESAVRCIGNPSHKPRCSITAMRDSRLSHQPADITPFLFPAVFKAFFTSLAHNNDGTYSLTEKYLNDTDTPLLVQDTGMELFRLSKETFSQRLTQLINTYYLGSLFPSAIVGGLDAQLPVYTLSMYTNEPITRTTAGLISTRMQDLYCTNVKGLAVFFIMDVAMFAAAAISCVLSYSTPTPDALGYISSLTLNPLQSPNSIKRSISEKPIKLGR
ncbi:predicted protein [Uncinocarpus reesii 1704]|uniref:Uncharacterized protein n=1 Tax=Uncinocarpus reesii (strain UAMH 1704) TaxID=336963 RepID=C4JSW9_UNCRE|nr:uncharacterized protein UREG_05558 [Uncinocarpus reesii 1704]EEP80716.1 predicted protein [Uncinocarpus reesii 1704]